MIPLLTRRSLFALPAAALAAPPPRVRLASAVREALATIPPEELDPIEKMNRADRKFLPRLPVLVLPIDAALSPIAWCTLPIVVPPFGLDRKTIAVHLPSQQFGAYESGVLTYWGPVNSGAADHPTPAGRFQLNWKSPGRRSSVNPDWFMTWYWNIDEKRGIAMHAYELPGTPASHACIRLLDRDARWLFDWGVEGTPVSVVGQYGFAAPPPWRSVEFWNHTVALEIDAAPLT